MRTKRAQAPALSFACAWPAPRSSDCGGWTRSASAACFRPRPRRSSRGGNWRAAHYVRGAMASQQQSTLKRLDELFAAEPDRLSRLSFEVAGLYFDWSKTHLDQSAASRQFVARAEADGLRRGARRACSPARSSIRAKAAPATHVAERGSGAPDDVDLATARRQRMRALVDAIEAGAFGDVTGILHIGIGGSVLGPALLVDALGRRVVDASTCASCRTSTARRSTMR